MARRRAASTTRRHVGHPVDVFLRRRQRWRAGSLLAALLVVLVLIVLDHYGVGLYATDDTRRYDGRVFEVVRVIDGDTIVLRVPDGDRATTTVRVWGVDTPELAKRDGSKPAEPLAEEATAFTRGLIAGGPVTLHLERYRPRGGYGRLLAHVELADGSQLGAKLIGAGLSVADDRWSHRYLTAYELLELEARVREVGRWARGGRAADNAVGFGVPERQAYTMTAGGASPWGGLFRR